MCPKGADALQGCSHKAPPPAGRFIRAPKGRSRKGVAGADRPITAQRGAGTSLSIHLEGDLTAGHRIPFRLFSAYGHALQIALERVALVLLGAPYSVVRGRRPVEVEAACNLQLAGLKGGGSMTAECELPLSGPQRSLFGDLGQQGIKCLVAGIHALEEDADVLPAGYDRGVLLALKDAGSVFRHGLQAASFTLRTHSGTVRATHTTTVHERIVGFIGRSESRQQTVEGRLVMGDFKETALRCRIEPALGRPLHCQFPEPLRAAVLTALTRYVRAYGSAQVEGGRVLAFEISRLEVVDGPPGAGPWDAPEVDDGYLSALIREQMVAPVRHIEDLRGTFWPEDEDLDAFIRSYRDLRGGGAGAEPKG